MRSIRRRIDSKLSDSQGTGLAGVVISDWNWQTESREFRLELTDTGYTWFDGATQLGTQTWADAGIDTEFGNGYRVMALGMNYDSGRGTSSIERVEVRNPGEPPKLIAAFGPSKGVVTAGQQSSLIWQIDPEASASIDQGIGNVDNRTTDGSGSIFIIPPDVTEPTSIIYTLTVTKGAEEEVREASLSVSPRPELVYDDFVDDFIGAALDSDLWETRGGKTFSVADSRVTWNDDGRSRFPSFSFCGIDFPMNLTRIHQYGWTGLDHVDRRGTAGKAGPATRPALGRDGG